MKHWKLKIIAEYNQPLAHEGPVFNTKSNKLFFTSNRLNGKNGTQYVVISQYDPITGITTDLGLRNEIPMANGAVEVNSNEIAFTMQGNLSRPAGIAIFNHQKNETRTLINKANGQAFNSPNDIIITENDLLFFTDPSYGYEQKFRPPPQLGNWVWSINLDGNNLRMVADGFSKPNGIALDVKRNRVLITDTGYVSGDGSINPGAPRTIYQYKLNANQKNPILSQRAALNIAAKGIPDGIKIDQSGNIWTGTAAGIEIFSQHGSRKRTIPIDRGISNLTFASPNDLYLLGGQQLWSLKLKKNNPLKKTSNSRKTSNTTQSSEATQRMFCMEAPRMIASKQGTAMTSSMQEMGTMRSKEAKDKTASP